MDRRIRSLVFHLVRLFYPRLEVHGRERLPATGPVIFVLNHPNALIDPLLLMVVLKGEVTFLVKSTLFKNPVTRRMLQALGVLPVYRQQDVGRPGGAPDSSPLRNEQTFERCRAILRQAGSLALFPEGETHSSSVLLPPKTGAARIALSAEAASGWQLGLKIVPVGLWYQNKARFRSSALLVVGQPFCITDYQETYSDNQRRAARELTTRIAEELSAVVLQAENAELLSGTTALAAWLAADEHPPTLAQLYERARALLAAHKRQAPSDPGPFQRLAQQAQRHADSWRRSGIGEQWGLTLPAERRRRSIVLLILLVPSLPLAAVGLALSYVPYQLTRLIAPRLTRHQAQVSTSKLIVGTSLMVANWLALAALVARKAGRRHGLRLLLAAPLFSYLALRWTEGWRELRQILNLTWLHSFRVPRARELLERRAQLRQQIKSLLYDLEQSAQPDTQHDGES